MNKKLLLFATALLLHLSLLAQAPHMFSYQAVVRNAQGYLVTNSDVRVKISILQGSEDGVSVYTEQHVAHTNQNGLFTLNIGEGSDGLAAIDWEHGPYYIRTEVDPSGGNNFSLRTVQQMMSVPYALHAYSVDTVIASYDETDPLFSAWDKDYNDLTNKPTIPTVPDSISAFVNDAGYLTSFTESQVLTISNDTLFLSGGSFVVLPTGFSGSYNDLTDKPELFSGDYNDLVNKPNFSTITGVPDSVSAFINDAGYLTTETDPQFTAWNKSYNDLTNRPNIGDSVRSITDTLSFLRSYTETDPQFTAWNKSYNDLTNRPNIGDSIRSITDTLSFLRSYTETDPQFTAWNKSYNDLTNRPNIGDSVRSITDTLSFLRSYTETDPQFTAWNKSYNDLTNRPNIGDSIRSITDTLSFLRSYTETDPQFTAWNKSYNDLTNRPNIGDSVRSITDTLSFLRSYTETDPQFTAWNKSYNDLTNRPNIGDSVRNITDTLSFLRSYTETDPQFTAWNKSYNDLTNRPNIGDSVHSITDTLSFLRSYTETDPQFTAWNKSYNDLTDKPTIPTVPTNVGAFTNDAGYLTAESQTLSQGHDTIFLTGGSYVVLPEGFSGNYNDLTNKPTIFSGSYNDLSDKPELFGGNYNDLTNRPNIHDSIDAYLDTTTRFDYYESDPVFTSWLCGWSITWDEILNKPTIFSGDYNDLANKPNIHDTIEAYLDTTTQFLRSYTETQNLSDVLANGNSAGNRQIKNIADPTADKDAVNKQTVDAIVAELRHYYDSIIDYQRRVIDTLASTATGDLAFDENGATKSEFTINGSGGKVHFSRGNLQYLGSGPTYNFQFATNQFDIIGLDNTPPTNAGATPASAYRDLFIWYSGSVQYGNQCARTTYTSTYSADLTNGGWGELNKMHISNGGGENWRTLTMDEWNYLLQTRTCSRVGTTNNARFVHIMVNGIVGTIIFPDAYVHPSDVPVPARINSILISATNPITNYNLQQFRKMELAGAAFLPAAGYLFDGSVQGIKQIGFYWSTTRETTTKAKFAQLYVSGGTDLISATNNRNYALPVRLVLDVE